jgi:hypothetical protein
MQPLVGDKLGRLRTLGAHLRLPLRYRRAVLGGGSASGGIAAQLARNCRWVPADLPSDLADSGTLGLQQRDLLALMERQVAPRQWREIEWRHTASVVEPPLADRLRRADSDRGRRR